MLNSSQSFAIKIIFVCLLVLGFALLVGCASNPPPQPTTPTDIKVCGVPGCLDKGATAEQVFGVPPRDDCPNGYAVVANKHGTACWPRSEPNPPASHCRPERCPETGYMLWNCPVPVPARDEQGNLELEEAIGNCPPEHAWKIGIDGRRFCEKIVRGPDGCPENGSMRTDSRGRTACLSEADKEWLYRQNASVDSGMTDPCPDDPQLQCWWFMEEADPDLQDKLAAEVATYQCLLRMGPERVRKVAFTASPGKFLMRYGMPVRDAAGRLVFKDGGHLFTGVADQQGRFFFCPFRADCDVSAGPRQDEDCLDFANCQEVCRDPQGAIIPDK